jgi:2-polyprenyl-3-methyl-5-hydroxy-6-metoxy-1,4-benzoquinol methylase
MTARTCWCGADRLIKFSAEYFRCLDCNTLVSQAGLSHDQLQVKDDAIDFYGKQYWLEHQSKDLGYPDINQRARLDLPERCIHWLKTLLKYRLPPAKTLELGCAHGGFVALQNFIGYDAQGLELSHWVAEFAKKTFRIEVFEGPIEKQNLPSGSYQVVQLMDVLEHLPDPTKVMKTCLDLLSPEGIFIIQTPRFQPELNYEQILVERNPFLDQLKANEHLYLFSEQAIKKFFENLGVDFLAFEPAIFSHYDMFFVLSRRPLTTNTEESIHSFLSSTTEGRIVQALIDLRQNHDRLVQALKASEEDRIAKLDQIRKLTGTPFLPFIQFCKKLLRKLAPAR